MSETDSINVVLSNLNPKAAAEARAILAKPLPEPDIEALLGRRDIKTSKQVVVDEPGDTLSVQVEAGEGVVLVAEPVAAQATHFEDGAEVSALEVSETVSDVTVSLTAAVSNPVSDSVVPDQSVLTKSKHNYQIPFSFNNSELKQVRTFPEFLEELLRAALVRVTNKGFASDVSISSLVTGFVIAQFSDVVDDTILAGVDENTRNVATAFRYTGDRMGAVENQLLGLHKDNQAVSECLGVLQKRVDMLLMQDAAIVNGVSFLITDKLHPELYNVSQSSKVNLVSKQSRHIRGRLESETRSEISQNVVHAGRPIR